MSYDKDTYVLRLPETSRTLTPEERWIIDGSYKQIAGELGAKTGRTWAKSISRADLYDRLADAYRMAEKAAQKIAFLEELLKQENDVLEGGQ